MAPVSSKEVPYIQLTIECRFTRKRVGDMDNNIQSIIFIVSCSLKQIKDTFFLVFMLFWVEMPSLKCSFDLSLQKKWPAKIFGYFSESSYF